eukprot:986311-Amorphochlora_amoeboformis.AAC.1
MFAYKCGGEFRNFEITREGESGRERRERVGESGSEELSRICGYIIYFFGEVKALRQRVGSP